MFHVLTISYEKPLDIVDQTRPAHLAFLNDEVAAGRLLLAGRLHDGSGGVLITADISIEDAQSIIDRDPYTLAAVASYSRASFNGGIRAAGL
ncbi:YciI family protein [Mycolicibacterium sarraceniae]|uniref:GTP cyclohydrolase II n=1 Tax=Mycolicibacterium sarraceniae TaxID=1534348 RepID=A0A7I7SJ05_9MYCO|nr:YciI family protein [Mycolicibacterium sarraceniae]BBY56922.1 GTP cyclohydrolase II [Mycolicibacterium sarraceniae]